MKKIQFLAGAVAAIVFFTQCSPKAGGAVASSSTSSSISSPAEAVAPTTFVQTNYSDEVIELGKATWRASCGKCHKLYQPNTHSMEAWERILPRMSKKAKLDDRQAEAVRAFVLSNVAG